VLVERSIVHRYPSRPALDSRQRLNSDLNIVDNGAQAVLDIDGRLPTEYGGNATDIGGSARDQHGARTEDGLTSTPMCWIKIRAGLDRGSNACAHIEHCAADITLERQ